MELKRRNVREIASGGGGWKLKGWRILGGGRLDEGG